MTRAELLDPWGWLLLALVLAACAAVVWMNG